VAIVQLNLGRPPLSDLRIALYQPDIAGNTGTILRLAACLGVAVDIIEPAGFDVSDRNLRRAGMDYLEMAALRRHIDFAGFDAWRRGEVRRLVLLSTKAALPYTDFAFQPSDILLVGRESAGVPESVHALADARILIPMPGGGRSLNVALAAAMTTGEALRQVGHPGGTHDATP
jgi:tRNA (cytidine/uridine-2'-O-)-methyltransferase